MADLATLIQQCIDAKQGSEEFALFYFEPGWWRAEIGNTATSVMLGEASAEYSRRGKTPQQAVERLLSALLAGVPEDDVISGAAFKVRMATGKYEPSPDAIVAEVVAAQLGIKAEHVLAVIADD